MSRTLRNLLANKSDKLSHNHDSYIKNNFLGYVKNVIKYEPTVLPSFSKADCLYFFTKCFSARSPNKRFPIHSWTPSLAAPQVPFLLDPPSYQQITKIIHRMKASACPFPLHQAFIISIKRYPYL